MKKRVKRLPEKEPDYLSYLLRLWRANDGKRHVWRASLENSLTTELPLSDFYNNAVLAYADAIPPPT